MVPINAAPKNENKKTGGIWTRNEKQHDVRHQNIIAAKAIANAVRTSLGPKGMDKMIQDAKGGVIITNDGATILKEMSVVHPTAKMMVELSNAQDIEAGDGTTTVVVICGAMLDACEMLVDKGIHPQLIAHSFLKAELKAQEILNEMAVPVDLSDRDALIKAASTSLNSKVVSQSAGLLAPIAVDAVLNIIDQKTAKTVDLNNIRIIKKVGGTVDDCELINGLVFSIEKISRKADGPRRMTNAKIGLIQFCLSSPKTDMDNNIVVKDYQSMDRLLKEERIIIAKTIKHIANTGCNVLFIQKSILRDAVTDISLDFLAKAKILVVKDIEREDIEFISKTCGCEPVAHLDQFVPDVLGHADLVYEEDIGGGDRLVKVTGVQADKTVSILIRASNGLILDETERSLHDAICVVRSLVKTRAIVSGGAAPEMELSQKLLKWSRTLSGHNEICTRAYADAFEVIPYTLAENAGLDPIQIVTELRNKHADESDINHKYFGINVRKGCITNILEENVIQPVLVTQSAVKLATETVMMILKIDDIVMCR